MSFSNVSSVLRLSFLLFVLLAPLLSVSSYYLVSSAGSIAHAVLRKRGGGGTGMNAQTLRPVASSLVSTSCSSLMFFLSAAFYLILIAICFTRKYN